MFRFLRRSSLASLLLLLAAGVFSCWRKRAVETRLFTLAADPRGEIYSSDDGKYWCYKIGSSTGEAIAGNREYGGAYSSIANIRFTRATGRCGYFALTLSRDKIVLVVDGQERPVAARQEGGFNWSPDGRRWAAWWEDSGKQVVVLDGKQIGRYDSIATVEFTPDSAHYAFAACDASGAYVVMDGRKARKLKDPPCESLGVVFSRIRPVSAKHVAGVAPLSTRPGFRFGVIQEDKTLANYSAVVFNTGAACMTYVDKSMADSSVVASTMSAVSENGASIAWWGRSGDKAPWACFLNGKKMAESQNVDPCYNGTTLSPDGKRLAFLDQVPQGPDKRSAPVVVWLDGKRSAPYESAGGFTFSADSRRFGYWARKAAGQKFVEVVDGAGIAGESDSAPKLRFSPDSGHLAFLSETGGRKYLVHDGTVRLLRYDSAWGLSLESGGTPRFFGRKRNEVFMMVGVPEAQAPPKQ